MSKYCFKTQKRTDTLLLNAKAILKRGAKILQVCSKNSNNKKSSVAKKNTKLEPFQISSTIDTRAPNKSKREIEKGRHDGCLQ